MKRFFSLIIASAVTALAAVPAEATLTTIGTADYGSGTYSLIHDDDLGLVWLDYTRDWDTWQNQMDWAAGLNADGLLNYNVNPGISVTWSADWRLPDANPVSFGYNITTSEMGHLNYSELGNLGQYVNGTLQPGYGLANTGLFTHLQSDIYWSGTTPYNGYAMFFNYENGYQGDGGKAGHRDAMAVRSANVAATSVPEPSTFMLLGSGLGGFAMIRRFRRK